MRPIYIILFLLLCPPLLSQDVEIYISDIGIDFIDIYMTNTVEVGGFQMQIEDVPDAINILGASGGAAEINGFTIATEPDGLFLGYHIGGETLPVGDGLLCTVNIIPNEQSSITYLSLSSITIGDIIGEPISVLYDQEPILWINNPGCTDLQAINYNPDAFFDDGTCIYLEDIDPFFSTEWSGVPYYPMGFYVSSASIDGVELRVGDEIAIFDNELCVGLIQLQSEIESPVAVFASQDNPSTDQIDGFIDGNEILYRFWDVSEQIEIINVFAEVTDGSLMFQSLGFSDVNLSVNVVLGCTDPDALNFDPNATINDGNCIYTILGCTDETACNFNQEANTDDGSCLYFDCIAECGGLAYIDDCGVCDDDPNNDNACVGCTDPWALNFEEDNTIDDGSCEYPGFGDIVPDGILNILDIVVLVNHILDELPYVFYIDLNSDGYNNIIDIVILVDVILHPEMLGCTDPLAINFNPNAIYDNWECLDAEFWVTDIDGNFYQTITIGDQTWMTSNLNVEHYNNGDPISTGFTDIEWLDLEQLQTGGYAEYNFESDMMLQIFCGGDCGDLYGYLYNWYAVNDNRGICPEGMHVPSDNEWIELEIVLGMSYEEAHDFSYRGTDQGSQLAGNSSLWFTGDLESNPAFGLSGFYAIPAGYRSYSDGQLHAIGQYTNFWTITDQYSNTSWMRELSSSRTDVRRSGGIHTNGYSVRCMRY